MRLFICKRPGFKEQPWVGALLLAAPHRTAAWEFCVDNPVGEAGFVPEEIVDVGTISFDIPCTHTVVVWNDETR